MIKHNELANRLNNRLYKDTAENEEDDKVLSVIEELSPEVETTNTVEKIYTPIQRHLIDYIEFVINVVCFGFAAQLLLNATWPIIGTLAVGYSINFIFNKILFLFSS